MRIFYIFLRTKIRIPPLSTSNESTKWLENFASHCNAAEAVDFKCSGLCIIYGAECWTLKVKDKSKLKTTEMRMLRVISDTTLEDKINNEKIREMTAVDRLKEFLRELKLRWLEHVKRIDERGPVKALRLEIERTKNGRPKKKGKKCWKVI